jgi:flagellar P-ring protein precursor FlgI
MPQVVQPLPFSRGRTETEQRTAINADEAGGSLTILAGPNLQTLVSGLNRMGLKPQGIIAILQAIKSAGALQAELVVQ